MTRNMWYVRMNLSPCATNISLRWYTSITSIWWVSTGWIRRWRTMVFSGSPSNGGTSFLCTCTIQVAHQQLSEDATERVQERIGRSAVPRVVQEDSLGYQWMDQSVERLRGCHFPDQGRKRRDCRVCSDRCSVGGRSLVKILQHMLWKASTVYGRLLSHLPRPA